MVRRAVSRQPDTDTFRSWEVAGSSQVDIFFRVESNKVSALGAGRHPATVEIGVPNCERPSYSRVPFRYSMHAACDHLVRWVDVGTPPLPAPPIAASTVGPPAVCTRDSHGNALGGIRLAAHAVPTATNTGMNSGDGFCRLYGSHEPFDPRPSPRSTRATTPIWPPSRRRPPPTWRRVTSWSTTRTRRSARPNVRTSAGRTVPSTVTISSSTSRS